MLWFKKDDDKKKRRRRRSSSSESSRGAERWDSGDRKSRSKRSSSRKARRSTKEDQRETRREDTRDRDERRKEKQRDRTVAKEQEETFGAINFDGTPIEIDEVDRTFARVLTVALYVLLGLLVTGIVVYAVGRGVSSRRAARVVPLQNAAYEGDIEAVRTLTAEGLPVDGTGPDGGTPLAAAILGGQTEAAQALLDLGAKPTDHIMRMAMRYQRWEILEALIRAGGDPEVRGAWSGRSPLELAVERQDMEMVRVLLAHGADAGAVSNQGPVAEPALHYAAEHGMTDYVDLLLEYGADPRKLWMGYAPRDLAQDAGHEALAQKLAEAEAAMRGTEIPSE